MILSCVFCTRLQAQNPGVQELYKVTQVPPDAAALGKYGEYPVGYYTGVPSINIPFYELTAGRIKIPIGVSYHAGGIKVEEIASSVGLGWALNAGGVITRTVMGLPDEVEYLNGESFINPTFTSRQLINMATTDPEEYYKRSKRIVAGRIDGEPDIYYFNFGNMSGKFMYNQQDHKFYSIPYSKIKIEFYAQASNSSFTLTDENGIEYLFEEKEYSLRETDQTPNPVVTVTTSWYIKSIYDPVSKQTVYFSYSDLITSQSTLSSETYTPLFASLPDYSPVSRQNATLHLKRLNTISTESGTILFDYGLSRCDLPGNDALTGILIRNNDGKNIKEFKLNYDYFVPAGYTGTDCGSVEESGFKRLKLTGIDENPGEANGGLKHRFEYNGQTLPSRFSKAQDHWGFYNGATGNQHLYPPYSIVVQGTPVYLPGGNRDVQPSYAKACVLEKITYPTGGYTLFDFESNTAVSSQAPLPALSENNAFSLFSGGENYLEKQFSVYSSVCSQNLNQPGVYLTMNVTGLDYGLITAFGFPGISALVKVINLDTEEEHIFFQIGGDKSSSTTMPKTFYLPNGDYKFIVDYTENPFSETYAEARVSLSWINCLPPTDMGNTNTYVGGLRLKKLTSVPVIGETPVIKTYKYMQPASPTLTSGQTHFYPRYFSFPLFSSAVSEEGRFSTYLKRTSNSNYPLVSEHGKSVGYSYVQEYNGLDDSNGYTQYNFTNYSEYDDELGERHSYLPVSKQWLRGLELGKKVYVKSGTQTQLLSETINEYNTQLLGVNRKVFEGIRGEFIHTVTDQIIELPGEDMVFLGAVYAGIAVHPTYADFVYLSKSKERIYNGANYVETIKDFTYNARNLQASTVTTTASDGRKTILQTRYPLDYTVNTPLNLKAQGIKHLQDINFISPVIERFAEQQQGSSAKKLIGANYYSYLPDRPLVDSVFTMNLPLAGISDYTGISIGNGSFTRNAGYEADVIVDQYSLYRNNILQQKKSNAAATAYIWDHEDLYPIAQVTNASFNDIAFTSFESTGTGNWNYSGIPIADAYAVTGYKSYGLTSGTPVSKTGLNTGKVYVLSYWAKGTGGENISGHLATAVRTYKGWTNYVVEITGTNTVTLTGALQLDEVRLYPKDSQMSSYTYELLLGLTSATDAKGMTTYYEYDNFQRLKYIKDQDGNIVKSYDYHYKP